MEADAGRGFGSWVGACSRSFTTAIAGAVLDLCRGFLKALKSGDDCSSPPPPSASPPLS